jgi:hypothetical protein
MLTDLRQKELLLSENIGAALCQEYAGDKISVDISLFQGDAGMLCLQAILSQASPEPQLHQAMEHNFSGILNMIEASAYVTPTFADGLAGVGVLIGQLCNSRILDADAEDFCEDLDVYLAGELDKMLLAKKFDPLHGAIGIGGYYLQRRKTNEVQRVLQALLDSAEKEGNEWKWSYCHTNFKQEVYDFGAAHGMAGIARFLVQCHRRGIMPAACREMLRGIIDFYLDRIQDHAVMGSWFPNFQYCDPLVETLPERSRVAWCYGDAGILYQLFHAAVELQDTGLQQKFERMLEATADRREVSDTMVSDAAFCHGSTGPGLIFWLLWQATGNLHFEEAFRYWREVTQNFVTQLIPFPDGEELFPSHANIRDFQRKGLFSGLGGIAVFLTITGSSCQMQQQFMDHWKDLFQL